MKRMHVHVSVADLSASIRFYKTLFGAAPVVIEKDYAKWMLADPKLNFAISTRGRTIGLDHLGLQVDDDEELHAMRAQLEAADAKMLEQRGEACCYARSNKHWVTDPSGIAWESFHTLSRTDAPSTACCGPARPTETAPDCCTR
jgi:catechol 2,3-dioxygenase-like lactoylglutathione lyase family enzyme